MPTKEQKDIKKLIADEVKKLAKLKYEDEYEIITRLQSIGKILVTSAMFESKDSQSKDYYIYPLLVEAYYYHEDVFMDDSSYCQEEQANNQYRYYPHAGKGMRAGIDIVLSDSKKYYLSYLLKCVLIKDKNIKNSESEFLTQMGFYQRFNDSIKKNNDSKIQNAMDEDIRTKDFALINIRSGLSKECDYKHEYLATVTNIIKYKKDEKYKEEYKKLRESLYGDSSKDSADDGFGGGVEGLLFRNIEHYQSLTQSEKA